MAAFSLAMNSTIADRVQALYDFMILSQGNSMDEGARDQNVSIKTVEKMVQHLQSTCQLVPDAQIVPTVLSNIPYQMYRAVDGAE